jgi:hypothetical protein
VNTVSAAADDSVKSSRCTSATLDNDPETMVVDDSGLRLFVSVAAEVCPALTAHKNAAAARQDPLNKFINSSPGRLLLN